MTNPARLLFNELLKEARLGREHRAKQYTQFEACLLMDLMVQEQRTNEAVKRYQDAESYANLFGQSIVDVL